MNPIPGGMNAGVLKAFITADTKGLTTGLTRASAQITQFANVTKTKMASVNAVFVGLGKAFMATNVLIGGALALSVTRFAKFDKAMRESTAVSKVTEEQYKKMAEMAKKASIDFNIAADKTAQGFYFLGSAGLIPEDQMKSFNATILLSKAGVMGVGEAAEILVDVMKGFKIPFTDTLLTADKLTAGFTSANHTMSQLGEAMKYAAGISKTFNNDLEDIIASFGFFADIGVKGSMAGTSMRRVLTNLAAPTSKMRSELEKFVDVYDKATGNMRPFIDIMIDYTDAIKDVGEEERNMSIKTIFGARAINGMSAIVDRGGEALREYRDSIRDAGGMTQKVADWQMKSFSEQLGVIFKVLNDIVMKVGELAVQELAGGVENLTKKLKDFNTQLNKNNSELEMAIKNVVDYINFWGKVFKYVGKALHLMGLQLFTVFDVMRLTVNTFVIFVKDSFELVKDSIIFAFEGAWLIGKSFFTNFDTAMNMLLDWDWEGLRDLIARPFAEAQDLTKAKFVEIQSDAEKLANNLELSFTQMKDQMKYLFAEGLGIFGLKKPSWKDLFGQAPESSDGGAEGIGAGPGSSGGGSAAGGITNVDIWTAVGDAVEKAGENLKKFNKDAVKGVTDMQKAFSSLGQMINEAFADQLADAFMGAKFAAKDFFEYLMKMVIKKGIMMILNAVFSGGVGTAAGLGFGGLPSLPFVNGSGPIPMPGGRNGGLFSNYGGGRISVPGFAGGISGYQIPSNVPMDTMPVMVGGGEELDVRSVGQVSERDEILRSQLTVLNKLVTAIYETETKIGDAAIREANNRGKILLGEF